MLLASSSSESSSQTHFHFRNWAWMTLACCPSRKKCGFSVAQKCFVHHCFWNWSCCKLVVWQQVVGSNFHPGTRGNDPIWATRILYPDGIGHQHVEPFQLAVWNSIHIAESSVALCFRSKADFETTYLFMLVICNPVQIQELLPIVLDSNPRNRFFYDLEGYPSIQQVQWSPQIHPRLRKVFFLCDVFLCSFQETLLSI